MHLSTGSGRFVWSVVWMMVLFGGGLYVSTTADVSNGTVEAIVCAVGGLLFGVTFTGYLWWAQRRLGGWTGALERTRAVRSGLLPPSADRSWLPALRNRRRNARSQRWLFPVLGVGLLALGVAHLRDQSPAIPAYWFLLGAMFIVLALSRVPRTRHDLPVLDRFIAELEDSAGIRSA